MIEIRITGETEQEIEQLAQAADLTPGQWLRVAIGAAVVAQAENGEKPNTWYLQVAPDVTQGKALSDYVACSDPRCPDAWAEHDAHNLHSLAV